MNPLPDHFELGKELGLIKQALIETKRAVVDVKLDVKEVKGSVDDLKMWKATVLGAAAILSLLVSIGAAYLLR